MIGNHDFPDVSLYPDSHNFIKKPIPVLQQQKNELSTIAFLINHVKSKDFEINLFEVSEENLKNLKNTKQNFQASSLKNGHASFTHVEDISKKEKMEYMIGNIVLNT